MKKIAKILIILLCFSFLLIASLPMLLSTNKGTSLFLSLINKAIEGKVEIEELKVSWLGKQSGTNFSYTDKEGKKIAEIKNFSTHTPLIVMLLRLSTIGETHVEDFSYIYIYEPKEEKEQDRRFIHKYRLSDSLYLKNGHITIEKKGEIPTHISNIQLELHPKEESFHIEAAALTGAHQGTLLAKGSLGEKSEIVLTNFPLVPFAIFEKTRWIPEALGPELSAEILLQKRENKLTLSGTMNSLNLHAKIEGEGENNLFIFSPQSALTFTLTPAFFKQSLSLNETSSLFLADATQCNLILKKLEIPLSYFDVEKSVVDASFTTTPITLIYKEKSYSFDNFEGSLHKDSLLSLTYQAHMRTPNTALFSGSLMEDEEGNFSLITEIDKVPGLFIAALLGVEHLLPELNKTMKLDLQAIKKQESIVANVMLSSEDLNIIGTLKGKNVNKLNLTLKGDILFEGEKKALLGEQLHLDLAGSVTLHQGSFGFAIIQGSAMNSYINMQIKGRAGKAGAPFSWDLVNLILTGDITLPPDFIKTNAEKIDKSYSFYLYLEGSDNTLIFDMDLDLLQAKGQLKNFVVENKLNFKKAEWLFDLSAEKMPVAIIDALLPKINFLPDLLGPTLSLSAVVSHNLEESGYTTINLDASSEGFTATAALQLNDTLTLLESKPTQIHYNITKQRYLALLKYWPNHPLPPFILSNESALDFTLTQLTCPKSSTTTLKEFICKTGFMGTLTIKPLTFTHRTEPKHYTIESINASVKGVEFSKEIAIDLHATFHIPDEENTKISHLTFTGEMINVFTEQGTLDPIKGAIKGEFFLDTLPTEIVLGTVPMEEKTRAIIDALLGDLITAQASIDIKNHQGPIQLTLAASNFKATCPLYFTQNNTLTLTAPLNAEIELTHKINETLIKDINPILISGIYSTHPLHLQIAPEGFSFPLFPFQFRGIQINNASIAIDKIEVVNGGEIQKIMEFVKADELTQGGVMTAWFTPLYFTLNDGIIKYKRFDLLLAGNVHLAFWGRIDLNKDTVRMTMAISPATLQRGLGIKGLTSKQMFHVKMTGPTSNVELDWSAAKVRLGIIVASSAGGHIGSLVGGLVEQIVTNLGERPTPPPTTDPLPWQK